MSDAGKTPEPTATAPTTTETRSEKAPVGDVSGEPVKVTDETGVPATESKEEKSVLDEAQGTVFHSIFFVYFSRFGADTFCT
jgi:hypothetical protein